MISTMDPQAIREALKAIGIDVPANVRGNIKTLCPNCSHTRKPSHRTEPCLSVNVEEGVYRCHNACGFQGSIKQKKKQYVIPDYTPTADLTDRARAYLKSRGLTEAVLARNKVTDGEEYLGEVKKRVNCIQFPYFVKSRVVNIKYRDGAKHWKMITGAEMPLYKFDDLFTSDGNLHAWCAIVEGEIDALSLEVAGITQCVSVPNGASNFKVLDEAVEVLGKMSRIRIAVDNDEAGQKLERELVRRLGSDKCLKVVWPEGCKDANDVLVKYGAQRVRECVIDEAQDYPAPGIVRVRDVRHRLIEIYEHGREQMGVSTGWSSVDTYYRPVPGQWSLVTAMPNVGKSPWLRHLMINIGQIEEWKFGLWAPEDDPIEDDMITMVQQFSNKPYFEGVHERMSPSLRDESIEWLDEHFFWIVLEEEESPTLEAIHEKARYLVERKGINGLLIDPFNEIEIKVPQGSTLTREISPFCKSIRQFSRRNEIHTWLVAHPKKLEKKLFASKNADEPIKTKYPVPQPYDVAESAHFRNKADVCIALDRDLSAEWGSFQSRITDIYVQKMKKKRAGRLGKVSLHWDATTGRYVDLHNAPEGTLLISKSQTPTGGIDPRYEKEPIQDDLPF